VAETCCARQARLGADGYARRSSALGRAAGMGLRRYTLFAVDRYQGIWLARSGDRGITWQQYRVADIEHLAYYPYLAARGSGELAATWFSGASESLRWRACRIRVERDHLRVSESQELEIEAWHVPDPPNYAPVRSTAGEYLSAIFLKSGEIAVVSPIQNPPAKRFGFTFWAFK
jgi:hypothetical protein